MQVIATSRSLPDINHPARDEAIANNTHSAIVQRRPLPARVGLLKNGQFFVQSHVFVHQMKETALEPKAQLGARLAFSEIFPYELDE